MRKGKYCRNTVEKEINSVTLHFGTNLEICIFKDNDHWQWFLFVCLVHKLYIHNIYKLFYRHFHKRSKVIDNHDLWVFLNLFYLQTQVWNVKGLIVVFYKFNVEKQKQKKLTEYWNGLHWTFQTVPNYACCIEFVALSTVSSCLVILSC